MASPYFSSARALPGSEPNGTNDLWVSERTESGWSEPVHLGGELSTPDVDSHPVETQAGLYFHSRREGGAGAVDAYFAPGSPGQWGTPELLPFNSPRTDGEVTPTPDGDTAVFYSDRDGGFGRGDLYVVRRDASGWLAAENLGETINTDAWEWSPSLSPDGRMLLFGRLTTDASDSDIYVIPFPIP